MLTVNPGDYVVHMKTMLTRLRSATSLREMHLSIPITGGPLHVPETEHRVQLRNIRFFNAVAMAIPPSVQTLIMNLRTTHTDPFRVLRAIRSIAWCDIAAYWEGKRMIALNTVRLYQVSPTGEQMIWGSARREVITKHFAKMHHNSRKFAIERGGARTDNVQ